jgi:hypothetical protein
MTLRPEEWTYDEPKLAKQLMLTETASKAIDELAKELKLSRSEVLERAIRCGGLEAAKKFDETSSKTKENI